MLDLDRTKCLGRCKISAVMNKKPLPEWKKSEQVQTKITVKNEASLDAIIEDLETGGSGADHSESDPMISAGAIESADAMNFLVDRAVWMSEPVPTSKIETKEAEIETMIKFNHASKKLTIDHEVQTDLSCAPKFSNSMLLSGNYSPSNARRDFEQSIATDLERNEETEDSNSRGEKSDSEGTNDAKVTDFGPHGIEANLEKSVMLHSPSPKNLRRDVSPLERGQEEAIIMLPSSYLPITPRSDQTYNTQSPHPPSAAANDSAERRSVWNERSRRTVRSAVEPPAENYWSADSRQSVYQLYQSPSLWREPQTTEEILLTDEPSYVLRNLDEAAGNRYLNRACPSRIPFRNHPRSNNVFMNNQISYEVSSSSLHSEASHRTCRKYGERELPASDEEALQSLKRTFCTNIIAD